jgi:diketogulonate reductase-like aldo/keto reductase
LWKRGGGLAKNIGVSNFPRADAPGGARSSVRLINNQVEFHALIDQSKVMRKRNNWA